MNLHKWCSNSNEMITTTNENCSQNLTTSVSEHTTKALGMNWRPFNDELFYQFKLSQSKIKRFSTKRMVLSVIASLFDPLGLINPIIVTAKILMQDIWKSKLNWDESLPQALNTRWGLFFNQLNLVDKIKIYRYVMVERAKDIQYSCMDFLMRVRMLMVLVYI